MTKPQPSVIHPKNTNRRSVWMVIISLCVVGLIFGAISLAFLFESPSIRYKFGWDKVMLRTGKIVGLTAAILLLLQLPIAGRLKFLDRVFSLPWLYRMHRSIGYTIGLLIVLHPVLITLPEDRLMIPFETRYWPEWVGATLLLAILSQIALGRWRSVLIKNYKTWLQLHRFVGFTILALLMTHVLYVSETFQYEGLPRNAALIAALFAFFLWITIRGQRMWVKKKPFVVSETKPVGKNAYAIDIKPVTPNSFTYLPGQFAFFSFVSDKLSTEWHPFTLTSAPTRTDNLQIVVHRCGDWTNRINRVQKDDRIYVHGPFGRFSYVFEPMDREVIMIAGGIGITPMLSMLRTMADNEDKRRITLLWSNKTIHHLFYQDELSAVSKKLASFTWTPIFTEHREQTGEFGRLTEEKLKTLLAKRLRNAVVFLCGPPEMIRQVRSHLITLGFSAQSIKEELFGL